MYPQCKKLVDKDIMPDKMVINQPFLGSLFKE